MDSGRECRPRTAGKFSLQEEQRDVTRSPSVLIWGLLANNSPEHELVGRSVRMKK